MSAQWPEWAGNGVITEGQHKVPPEPGLQGFTVPSLHSRDHQSTTLPALLTQNQPNSSADLFWNCFPQFGISQGFKKTGPKKNVPRCKRCDMVHGEGSWVSVLLSNCCTKGISGRKELQPEAGRVTP